MSRNLCEKAYIVSPLTTLIARAHVYCMVQQNCNKAANFGKFTNVTPQTKIVAINNKYRVWSVWVSTMYNRSEIYFSFVLSKWSEKYALDPYFRCFEFAEHLWKRFFYIELNQNQIQAHVRHRSGKNSTVWNIYHPISVSY